MRGADAYEELEALYSGAPVGLGFWDTDMRFRRVNARLAEINGHPADEHSGRRPAELLGAVGVQAEAAIRHVLETGEPIAEMGFSGETPALPGEARHWIASFYPVTDGGEAIGVGGVVLDITDRVESAQRAETARDRAETLARASTALTSSMRTDRVLDELVRTVVPSLADVCAIHLARPHGGIQAIAVAAADPALQETAQALAKRQAADPDAHVGPAAVIRTGHAEINSGLTAEDFVRAQVDPEERRLLAELQVQSAAVLPLTARGAVLGSLTLTMGPSGRSYEPELVELAESIASGAALALDNARLFAEQVEAARSFQRALLPAELPAIPGVEVAARYRASGRSNQVGGDFYDVFQTGDGDWALLIGDVVGKGPQAAALTSLVRFTAQAAVLRGDGPEPALCLVDEALRRRPSVQFCSAVHGRLHSGPAGVRADLLSAGHPPPLVLRHQGAVETIEMTGRLLGVAPEPTFGAATVHLAPGDVLLLYTDGATELRGDDPWRGEAALRETVLASAGVTVAELVERVEHEALIASGGELRDDLALLAFGADPPEAQ